MEPDTSQAGDMAPDHLNQFHFNPDTYLEMTLSEVPDYLELQEATARATEGISAERILDLGVGTGETSLRTLAAHPNAKLTGLDENKAMLDHARGCLPHAELVLGRMQDPLPKGPYDIVVSTLAVHHLCDADKADLFWRVGACLTPDGRFVLGDLIVPENSLDALTPIDDDGHDMPSRLDDLMGWLAQAGFHPHLYWTRHDLVVIQAVHP
jgi:tRNA (cmo5U34)-methyltransferase